MRSRFLRAVLVCAVLLVFGSLTPQADTSTQVLPFSQDWTNGALISVDNTWTSVPGIVGYRGDGMVSSTGVDPQTVLADGSGTPVNVIANQTNTALTTGGIAEFQLANPTIAFQGSGTARAPHIVLTVSTAGRSNIHVSYTLRDIDGTADNSLQPVALQYRIGTSGNYTNVPAAFVPDASSGPSLATLVTPVSVDLPAAAADRPVVQVRIITTDAAGSDEWIGVDDLAVTGTPISSSTNPSGVLSTNAVSYTAGDAFSATVTVTPGTDPASTGISVTGSLTALGLGTPAFSDDGLTGGDAIAGDNVFTFTGVIPPGLTGGAKSIGATITDAQARTAVTPSVSVSVLAPTAPSGTGSANPATVAAGSSTQLTVTVTPGASPASTGITVTGDLSAIIPGNTAQPFVDAGNGAFNFTATVDPATTKGVKSLPITIADAQGRSSAFQIQLTVTPPLADSTVVISQLYGGGGNTGASYSNDFVQLYNRGTVTVDLTGWSLQYASAQGTSWDNRQPLGGTIDPGHYYLVSLAGGTAGEGAALPPANVSGQINMSGTTGKIALVDNYDLLTGDCPLGNPHIKDFLGYGAAATCHEGGANAPAPAPAATSAIVRLGGGFVDTNENGSDFVAGPPAPLTTTMIVELGPQVIGTDPRAAAGSVPRDATIQVTFTEPVDVTGAWFDITCTVSGQHDSATFAGTATDHYITPNVNFVAGERCTGTIFKDQVSDQDVDDVLPNTDHLPADYIWSFTIASGAAPPYPASVHLTMGRPSAAVADPGQPDDYLMEKPEYALSYNRDLGRPNWVSWHLTPEWFGTLTRVDTFRADPQVPPDWYRVQSFDFQNSGFDRGHMVPNADRDNENSIPINQATYLMSNMVAQAPDNNQGPWANLENYLRSLVGTRAAPTSEIYVVAGPAGAGGTGSAGTFSTIDNGHVTVPAYTWKVALVLPFDNGDDVSRVTCAARTIAVIMPNVQGIRTTNSNDWMNYLTTVDAVEALTGYDFFSNVPQKFQNCIQAGVNGDNPEAQEITVPAIAAHRFGDADFAIDATASSGLPVTLAVVSGPATIAGGLVHLTGPGTVTIRATQDGNAEFAKAVPVDRTFEVGKAAPSFAGLSAPTIEAGTVTTTIGGTLRAGALVPAGTVTITLAGATAMAALDANGQFSASLATASLMPALSPYAVAFSYAGDANVEAATAASTLTVVDNTAPVVGAVTATPNRVGAVNHLMFDVFVDYMARDNSGAPACGLAVSSNEAVDGTGDGHTSADWVVIDAHHVRLRAERAGAGNGRIYTLTVTCRDAYGHATEAQTTVTVPK